MVRAEAVMNRSAQSSHIQLDFQHRSADEMTERAGAFADLMTRRRTVRGTPETPVPYPDTKKTPASGEFLLTDPRVFSCI